MKNAYVLEHHYGDDGDTPAGSILVDVSTKRFDELEKKKPDPANKKAADPANKAA